MNKSNQSRSELMKAAQNGDKKAYSSLLERISYELRAYLIRKINSPEDCEDILQEVLISIHKARHTYDASRPFRPWMMAIANFRLNDFLRKKYRMIEKSSVNFENMQEQMSENKTDVTKTIETNELLDKAMQILPEKQRDIVKLLKIDGYSVKEVGEMLNLNVSAVKVSAHRAYKKLYDFIEQEDLKQK